MGARAAGARITGCPTTTMRKFDELAEEVELGAQQQQPPLPAADDGATPAAITLDWRRLDAWVAQRRRDSLQVLHGCWGTAQPGQVLSLMGPSGSGKTTLLNVLADRPTLGPYGSWTGSVMANGRALLPKRAVGYVMQRDIFFGDLTVREHLRCTAALRLPPEWSDAERLQELDRVVALLRLGPALDSFVGGSTQRGISGGELKRLNIATELLALPQLLVLDEPLSGLDSALADIVIAALAEVARERRTTVLMSVHQPSASMWAQFDQLLLMAEGGRTAFYGPASEALRHAASALSRAKPDDRSAAEWLIDCVSAEADRDALLAAHAALPPPADPPAGAQIGVRPRPSFARACAALLVRNVANTRRRELKKLEWILNIGLAVIFAGCFAGVGNERLSRQKDYISLLFFFVAHWSFHPVFKAVGGYPRQRDVLTRERASDSYPISAWFVANVLSEWAVSWVRPEHDARGSRGLTRSFACSAGPPAALLLHRVADRADAARRRALPLLCHHAQLRGGDRDRQPRRRDGLRR